LVGSTVLPLAPRIALAWLFVPCLAADGLMVPVLSSLQGPPRDFAAAIAFGIVGCVLAQGCLLAAWLAWGDGPFLRRLATHWYIAALLYATWLVGLVLATGGRSEASNIGATVAFGVPLISIAAQLPLWLARHLLGWRLVREQLPLAERQGSQPDPTPEPPLSIRDLMVATLVVAASLALARLAAPADGKEVWSIWAIAFAVASVVSSISLLPAGKLLLRSPPPESLRSDTVGGLRPPLFSRGLVWSGLYAAALIALIWIVVAAEWWFAPQLLVPRAIYVGLSSLMFTFAATLMFTATIAKDRRYRLTSRQRPK
jgi:hypothetical protein